MSSERDERAVGEQGERLAFQGLRGPRGEQGNQGNRGEPGVPGLSRPVRRALVVVFVLNLGLAGANLLWTEHEVMGNSQQRCSSVLADATIPLPHPAAGNPGREWDAAFEANARQRARQLGCPAAEGVTR